jgi:hypothetical protein
MRAAGDCAVGQALKEHSSTFTKENASMNYTRSLIAVTLVGVVTVSGTVLAQSPSQPAQKPAPETSSSAPSQPSTAQKVQHWTLKQWAAAKKEFAKDKEKWADCRKQASDKNLIGRKSWSFIYQCMTG